MSVEIDILIRQFDNFNIDHKIESLRSISISNMQKWKNSIEKDIKDLESQQYKYITKNNRQERVYDPSINAGKIKEKKDSLEKQNKAIEDKNKELDQLKKKYNSSEYMPNWYTDLFKFKYKTVDFHKDTIKQIKDFVFEELNKINFPICYCCYSFWTQEQKYENFNCNYGLFPFIKKQCVQDYQLIEDKIKDNTLIIYILNQKCTCGKLGNYQELLKNKNIGEKTTTDTETNEKKTDEETKKEKKEQKIDIIIYIQKFDAFNVHEQVDYLYKNGWIKDPERIKQKDYSSFRPYRRYQYTYLYKLKYESIDCTETIDQLKDYIFHQTTDVIKLPICKCCLWSIKAENNPDFNNWNFARKINIDYDPIIKRVRNYNNPRLKIDENKIFFFVTSTRDQCGRLNIYLRLYENQKIKKEKKPEETKKAEETKTAEETKEKEKDDDIKLILKKLTEITLAQKKKKQIKKRETQKLMNYSKIQLEMF